MSSSRQFVKDFQPPRIRALTVSSKDLFGKSPRDEKSCETEMSKAFHAANPIGSPTPKKGKINKPPGTSSSVPDTDMPPPPHRYSMTLKPSRFVDFLDDSLLPQTRDGLSGKSVDQIL